MDFIHKLAIAQKECDETLFLLELLKENDYLTDKQFESLYYEGYELLKIIRSVILTKKQKNSYFILHTSYLILHTSYFIPHTSYFKTLYILPG